jgi:hypothetical protein
MDAWMYISIPPYVFMTGSLIKHRYKFSWTILCNSQVKDEIWNPVKDIAHLRSLG